MSDLNTFTVTFPALISRINRRLKSENRRLRKSRSQAKSSIGNFYVFDLEKSSIVETHVDPVELARRIGVLHKWESVEAEGGAA